MELQRERSGGREHGGEVEEFLEPGDLDDGDELGSPREPARAGCADGVYVEGDSSHAEQEKRRRRRAADAGDSAPGDDLVDVLLQPAEEDEDRQESGAGRLPCGLGVGHTTIDPARGAGSSASMLAGNELQRSVNEEDIMAMELTMPSSMDSGQKATTAVVTSTSAKKRKRGRSGPDSRLAPNEESAITKAINSWETRQQDPIFHPYEGTIFNSFEEAKEFYNLYSWEIGFGIRISRGRENDNSYVTKKDLCCSCEGHCRRRGAASCRTGCRAMIRLLRTKDHGWYISRSVTAHNHALSQSCGEKKQWGSHSEIDPLTKDLIRRLRENNVSTGRVCSILRTAAGGGVLPVRREVVRSVCAKLAQDNIRDDLAKTMKILADMKSSDPQMEVRFKVDSSGRIMRMLWCTGTNKQRYKQFGDAITFDTTYRTNLYNLPFGLFVGVNNHFQSTVFGGVLLTTEKTEDFEWAFQTFIEIMGGKEPETILTDQCQAMAAAIKTTMKNTRHRWCKWHVLRKAKQYIGNAYSKKGGFKKEFHKLVTEEISPQKFERRWRQLVRKYKLEKNKFLNRIYKRRGMWARPYFMNVFCAGMTSTQRSESANHMLKQFIQRSAPMHLFVTKFNEFQLDRAEQEDKEIHVTKQVRRRRRIGVPIERHAEQIYTRAMYEKFSTELYYSGSYTIREVISAQEYKVTHYKNGIDQPERTFHVKYEEIDKIYCSCGVYEHSGMLCRHALKVLVHMGHHEIPSDNVLHRWTKSATTSEECVLGDRGATNIPESSDYIRNRLLIKRVLAASGVHGVLSEAALTEALTALDKLTRIPSTSTVDPSNRANVAIHQAHMEQPTQCPERPIRKGRPKNTSLKSYENGLKTSSVCVIGEMAKGTASSTDEENPRMGKTKALSDLVQPL